MDNLQRRASGIYVARLAVPQRLRVLVGKREFIATTGTSHLPVAKIVALALLARWRQQLFDLDRLALAPHCMNHDSIIKIAEGSPLLAVDGHLPLQQAAAVLGLDVREVLRMASDRRLSLFHRFANTAGHLVPVNALERDDPEQGTFVLPHPSEMPELAARHFAIGVRRVLDEDIATVAGELLEAGDAVLVAFGAEIEQTTQLFIPDEPVTVLATTIEVSITQVERLRRAMATAIPPARLEAARAAQKAALHPTPSPLGKHAHRLFSEALDLFTAKHLTQKITQAKEIQRVKDGIGLFIDFEGDLPLSEVDADRLRAFRDEQLLKVPARENQIRIKFKTATVIDSIKILEGTNYERMSPAERNQRMQWIARMFRWLKDQGWINVDPTAALRGESVETKAERKATALKKKDKERQPFTPAELTKIFGQECFRTGRGAQTASGTFREFTPFRYWLPLLGLHVGGRINELAQLRLEDVKQTESGTWYLDINENSPDKSLKKQKDEAKCWSARKVPLHPLLEPLGFTDWCARLRHEGFQRIFPELAWNPTKHYAQEPIRAMSQMLLKLGMPRDNTKVFHSFRHSYNNALMRLTCPPEVRKRLCGHAPGEGVNEQHYLTDPTPDETLPILKQLDFALPAIEAFDMDAGLAALRDALRRKNQGKGAMETLGGTAVS